MTAGGSATDREPRGITISLREREVDAEELAQLIEEAPTDDDGRRLVHTLDLKDSTVVNEVQLHSIRFTHEFSCQRARFQGRVGLYDVRCDRTLLLGDATYDHDLAVVDVEAPLLLAETLVVGGDLDVVGVITEQGVLLGRSRVDGAVSMRDVVSETLGLAGIEAAGAVEIQSSVVSELRLDAASFASTVRLTISADRIPCYGADFQAGLDLGARWAEIVLDESRFGAPSVVAFVDQAVSAGRDRPIHDAEAALDERLELAGRDVRPRIVSVRRANLDGLVLSGVDLPSCRFITAHNLDRLRLENDVRFARTGLLRGRAGDGRYVIGEEVHWRARNIGWPWTDLYASVCKPPDWLGEDDDRLETVWDEARLVASTYRSLRKGREDAKDEPGAADFYYGEMEMRRLDETTPFGERVILWLYWLVSGYGLRASRAFAALLVAVLVFALPLDAWGFDPDRGFGRSLLVSVQSTTSLLRGIDQPFTPTGEVIVTTLRLLGPVLFGLMLLSLRGRVKR
jgi:hypothetical protein